MELEINFAQNAVELKISEDIYRRILVKAIDQTSGDIAALTSAIENNEFESIEKIGHRLKGDFANLRITQLSELAKEMQNIALESKNKELLAQEFEVFKQLFLALESKLNS